MIIIKEIVFNNRVWIPASGKSRVIKLLLMILGAIYLATTFIQILFDGFSSINVFGQLILPFIIFGIGFFYSGKGGYIKSECRLAVDTTTIEVLYPHINKNDRFKDHSEKILIHKSSIYSIDYSISMNSIRIISRPKVTVEYAGKMEEVDFTRTKEPCTTILYFDNGQSTQVIDAIEQNMKIGVNRVG